MGVTSGWIRAGIEHQIHYLDDFLFIGAPNTDEGARALAIALQVLEHLGVPVAEHKTEGPLACVGFLGILIDSTNFELRLPPEKVGRLRTLLEIWQAKKSCKRKELESFLGHLSHAASVIRPGRTFLCHLFSLLRQVRGPEHYVRLNATARADIAWWWCFLHTWNGTSFFPLPDPLTHVHSDASGSFGCGALVEGLGWFQIRWPDDWQDQEITFKELVPVVAAAAVWGPGWAGQHIQFHSDNLAVVTILNTRTARTPPLVHLLRCFSFYCAHFGIHYSAVHVPGANNTAADALSRNNLPLFSSLVAQTPQTTLPQALLKLLVTT